MAAPWNPDYLLEYQRRGRLLQKLNASDDATILKVMKYYQLNPAAWINDWCVTYDPRRQGLKTMPFILFPRQVEFIEYLHELVIDQESGLVEKARDMGATWAACAFSVWAWLFIPGASIGWGSRKEQLVDNKDDPDSIFQKMRMIINNLPSWMLPRGWNPRLHSPYMKITNPQTGATITGEAGDNIGRGGRKLMYFKDESAHYERPKLIEAALGDNTNVQVDISSVRGTGNVFYSRRNAGVEWKPGEKIKKGKVRVFIFDWRDHPNKTQEWYDQRREKAVAEGMLAEFAQEVDRDYTAAKDRIIIPQIWVKAAIDAHIKLGFEASGAKSAGLDVADEGGDKNALIIRHGVVMKHADCWGEGDTGQTARRAVTDCRLHGVNELYYDCIGVGAGVKAETNRLRDEGKLPASFRVWPWNAGGSVVNPTDKVIEHDYNSPTNEDYFMSLKIQGWWMLRTRFYKTYQAVTEGRKYNPEELISLPSNLPYLNQLCLELSQAILKHTEAGKIKVDKKGKDDHSPNLADAAVICYCPNKEVSILDVL